MKKHWDDFFVPPEADEFLDKVKIDFAKSFEVDESVWRKTSANSIAHYYY